MQKPSEKNLVYVMDCPTKTQSRRIGLKSGKAFHFPATVAPFHRKQVIITPRSTTLKVRLYTKAPDLSGVDSDDSTTADSPNFGVTIAPGPPFTMFTSDEFWLLNANDESGGTVYVNVMEIFYNPPS